MHRSFNLGPTPPPERAGSSILLPLCILIVIFICGVIWLLPDLGHPRSFADRVQSKNNLKTIELGLLNYHDTYGAFPPAYTVDENGRPLLSWRVLILPFVEQGSLYKKFQLHEPWSSDANQKLLSQMPDCFTSPQFREHREVGNTPYMVVVDAEGNSLQFSENDPPTNIAADGMGPDIVVVDDRWQMVPWTQPIDRAPEELLGRSADAQAEMLARWFRYDGKTFEHAGGELAYEQLEKLITGNPLHPLDP